MGFLLLSIDSGPVLDFQLTVAPVKCCTRDTCNLHKVVEVSSQFNIGMLESDSGSCSYQSE
jgi:hypothetical protein